MNFPADTEARLEAAIANVANTLADGFDPLTDVAVLIEQAVEVADAFDDMDGVARKALALAFLERVIEQSFDAATPAIDAMVESLDLPGPEIFERLVWDPALKAIAPKILKPALLASLPKLVDLVVDATAGKINVNRRPEGQ